MAQRRFSRLLVAGLIVGYIGMLLLILAIVTGSWFIVGRVVKNGTILYRGKPEGLFDDTSSHAKACQAFICLSFIVNIGACVLGMLSSYAVTRPRIAGFAVRRLKLQPQRVSIGPKISGGLYVFSGFLTMIAAAIAVDNFLTGSSVGLAWTSFVFCILACGLLFVAEPPEIPAMPCPEFEKRTQEMLDSSNATNKTNKGNGVDETLPRDVANAATLPFNERPTLEEIEEN